LSTGKVTEEAHLSSRRRVGRKGKISGVDVLLKPREAAAAPGVSYPAIELCNPIVEARIGRAWLQPCRKGSVSSPFRSAEGRSEGVAATTELPSLVVAKRPTRATNPPGVPRTVLAALKTLWLRLRFSLRQIFFGIDLSQKPALVSPPMRGSFAVGVGSRRKHITPTVVEVAATSRLDRRPAR
jgi:hypothetical protein